MSTTKTLENFFEKGVRVVQIQKVQPGTAPVALLMEVKQYVTVGSTGGMMVDHQHGANSFEELFESMNEQVNAIAEHRVEPPAPPQSPGIIKLPNSR